MSDMIWNLNECSQTDNNIEYPCLDDRNVVQTRGLRPSLPSYRLRVFMVDCWVLSATMSFVRQTLFQSSRYLKRSLIFFWNFMHFVIVVSVAKIDYFATFVFQHG
jgi:hypothetical protein